MRLLSLFLFMLVIICSCKTDKMIMGKNEQGSYYVAYKYRAATTDSVTVFGRVRTEHSDSPPAFLTIDGRIHYVGQAGSYKVGLGHGKHTLTALAMMYNELKIPSISLKAGDSIRIDFFLTASQEIICDGEGL